MQQSRLVQAGPRSPLARPLSALRKRTQMQRSPARPQADGGHDCSPHHAGLGPRSPLLKGEVWNSTRSRTGAQHPETALPSAVLPGQGQQKHHPCGARTPEVAGGQPPSGRHPHLAAHPAMHCLAASVNGLVQALVQMPNGQQLQKRVAPYSNKKAPSGSALPVPPRSAST